MATRVTGELYESLTGQLFEITRQLRQPNGYPYDPVKLQRHLQDAIEGRFPTSIYPISVNYGMKVEDAVNLGKYDWVHEGITQKNFPTKKKGEALVGVELIHLNRYVSYDQPLKELDLMGYRPADLIELCAFGAKYPMVQRGFPIVALGSVGQDSNGDLFVPCLYCLYNDLVGRELGLFYNGDDWDVSWRFAAVLK